MSKLGDAFSAFFGILFGGGLPADVAKNFGFEPPKPPPPPPPVVKLSDGALQMLGILQRDARLLDFLMEDIAPYSDDQVGAAVRNLHGQAKDAIERYVTLKPVIDGVEGTNTKVPKDLESRDGAIKLLGNVPASGKAAAGVLRHKGWRAADIKLPAIPAKQDVSLLAPAELEVE